MARQILAICLLLTSLLAQAVEGTVADPDVDVNLMGIIVFALIFVGGTGYLVWIMWKAEQKRKKDEAARLTN